MTRKRGRCTVCQRDGLQLTKHDRCWHCWRQRKHRGRKLLAYLKQKRG